MRRRITVVLAVVAVTILSVGIQATISEAKRQARLGPITVTAPEGGDLGRHANVPHDPVSAWSACPPRSRVARGDRGERARWAPTSRPTPAAGRLAGSTATSSCSPAGCRRATSSCIAARAFWATPTVAPRCSHPMVESTSAPATSSSRHCCRRGNGRRRRASRSMSTAAASERSGRWSPTSATRPINAPRSGAWPTATRPWSPSAAGPFSPGLRPGAHQAGSGRGAWHGHRLERQPQLAGRVTQPSQLPAIHPDGDHHLPAVARLPTPRGSLPHELDGLLERQTVGRGHHDCRGRRLALLEEGLQGSTRFLGDDQDQVARISGRECLG